MTVDARALRGHAERVSADQVRRARGRLSGLGQAEQEAVEELALTIGRSIADFLAERATWDPRIAAALSPVPGGAPPRGRG